MIHCAGAALAWRQIVPNPVERNTPGGRPDAMTGSLVSHVFISVSGANVSWVFLGRKWLRGLGDLPRSHWSADLPQFQLDVIEDNRG